MEFDLQELNDGNVSVYLSCGCNPTDSRITSDIRMGQDNKRDWMARMIPKGLDAKIAFHRGKPAGFVEFLPIEAAPAPVKGTGILFITDIHINDDDEGGRIDYQGKGLGRRLIDAVEANARDRGFKAMATIALDGPWMPASFYQKLNFSVVNSVENMKLLWKPFVDCPKPALWQGNFKPTIGKNVLHIDLVHSSQCWGVILQVKMWERIAKDYENNVVIEDHLTDDREIMCLASMTGSIGVYLNGFPGPGHPINEKQIRGIIEYALKRKADNNRTHINAKS